MAKKVEGFEEQRSAAPRRYDWDAWTDGGVWEITKGEDYDVATENMRVNLHMKAKQHGVKVRTQIVRSGDDEGLRFQFFEPPSGESRGSYSGDRAGNDPDDPSLEKRWHAEMLGIHHDAKEVGYNASRFIQMVNEHGGVATAKQLVNSQQPSDGFTKLWELQRLDISVEARALKPEYRGLFTASELKKCRERLAAYNWTHESPWSAPRA